MNKNLQVKNKKTLIKGTALAFATVMSVACFPGIVLASNSTETSYAVSATDNTIYLVGAGDKTVNVGSTYTITPAIFGNNYLTGTAIGNVKVTYQGRTVDIKSKTVGEGEDEKIVKSFEVANVGTYNICYTYEKDGRTYTLNYDIESTRSSAIIAFGSNLEEVLPSVYDLNYSKAKTDNTYKDVVLPLPTVYDEDENEIGEVAFYTEAETTRTATNFVVVSVRGPKGENVGLTHSGNSISIPGSVFGASDVNIGEYTITYAYYVKGPSDKQLFVTKTEKTFSVMKGYYTDYELKANVGSMPTFVTGVESTLPTPTATASFKNTSGASTSEEVNVKYSAKVFYSNDNGKTYGEEVQNAVVDGKFTPSKDGSYKIVYTVTDFYGNQKEIQGRTVEVSDTKKPEVYIYDASDASNYTDNDLSKAISEYVDASAKLKSKTGKDNVVVYAIGAKDNASSLEDIKLVRKIRTPSSSYIDVNISEYNAYNLIFNYNHSNLAGNDLLGKALSGKSEADADTWLKNNKFLKVVTSLAEVKTILADETITAENVSSRHADLVNAGYAYLATDHEITTGSYTFIYKATDKAGNEVSSDSYKMQIENKNVDGGTKPTVKVDTKFATSYSRKSVIEFSEPDFSDENDERTENVTLYRYLKDDKTVIGEDIILKDSYKIDLSGAPEDAAYVQIIARATNDYGETGEFIKTIAIIDYNDTEVPTVVSTVNPDLDPVSQNSEVTLPVTVYEDDYVAFMSAKVSVYLLDVDGKRKGSAISTTEASSEYLDWGNNDKGTFTFKAGKVIPPFAGNYEVMVQAEDAGNNIISTYYYFTATSTERDYFRLNVPSTINGDGKATVGDTVSLEIPSVTSSLTEGKEIWGVNEDGTAKYVSISVGGPVSPKKETNPMAYTFSVAGTYTFKYKAMICVYDSGKLAADEKGVYYLDGTEKRYAEADKIDGYSVSDEIKTALRAALPQILESDEYVLEVSEDSSAKVFEINYGSGEGYRSSYNVDEETIIYSAGAIGGEVDTEKSIISVVNPNNTTKEYKLSEIASDTKYKFDKNGIYTITYKILDKNGSEYSAKDGVKSFTIKVGDATKPEVGFKDGFLKEEYNLNESIALDISKIVLTDNGYGAGSTEKDSEMREVLLGNMKIVLTRVDDNGNTIEITNLGTDGAYQYNLENAGTYTLKVTTKDAVGNENSATKTFVVSTEGKQTGVSTKTVGIVLIVLACLILAGVIAYFVISRVRMNKKGVKKAVKKNKKD